MDEKIRNELLKHGWTSQMLDYLEKQRAAGPGPVDRMFLDGAQKALGLAGYTALEFLSNHPGLSKIELAKKLNCGASALGLIMAVYEEALRERVVRQTAKDLLIRQILQDLSDGWSLAGKMSPIVALSSWSYEIGEYAREKKLHEYASAIVQHLAKHRPPPDGWKPLLMNDPLIDEAFELHWPAE
jgi:hypothetical protein